MQPPGRRLAAVLQMLPPAAGAGVCPVCRTFTITRSGDPCAVCRRQPRALSVVVPISYSVAGGRLHRELRAYKDDRCEAIRDMASHTVATVLRDFLTRHEACVAAAAGVDSFALVTTVPSRTPRADASRGRLRAIAASCPGVATRFRRLLVPAAVPGPRHRWTAERYECSSALEGAGVLLIDDTWTTGASAQGAALALRRAGASYVALVVVGRHITPSHADNARRLRTLGSFEWTSCAVHGGGGAPQPRAAIGQPGGALVPPEPPRPSCAG